MRASLDCLFCGIREANCTDLVNGCTENFPVLPVCGRVLQGSDDPVDPELDDRIVFTDMPMMDEMQLALAPKPAEPCQRRPGQVILFMQVKVQPECQHDAADKCDQDQRSGQQVHGNPQERHRDRVIKHHVSLAVDIDVGRQGIPAVLGMMADGVVDKDSANPVAVPERAMQQGLDNCHRIVGKHHHGKKSQDFHGSLRNSPSGNRLSAGVRAGT